MYEVKSKETLRFLPYKLKGDRKWSIWLIYPGEDLRETKKRAETDLGEVIFGDLITPTKDEKHNRLLQLFFQMDEEQNDYPLVRLVERVYNAGANQTRKSIKQRAKKKAPKKK